jgi:broad specificity phosphatase PhoE
MIYLVRHGSHSLLDRILCGRLSDVSLSPAGIDQANELVARFAGVPIDVVQSSPRRRSRETAQPIAERRSLEIECADAMDELDAGEWSGCTFEALASDPAWLQWNQHRGSTRPPAGESMHELQARVVAHVEKVVAEGASTVIVTHAEPIRAVLLHYRKMPLDRYFEIEVPPVSVSILDATRDAVDTRIAPAPVLS